MVSSGKRCVLQPRCRLCQFDLLLGDEICFALDPIAEKYSCQFEFEKAGQKCIDHGMEIEFHFSRTSRKCGRCNTVTFCLHRNCLSWLPLEVTRSFIAATRHAWIPPQAEKRRRLAYLHEAAAERLCESDIAPQIPSELWSMVARHLVREYAGLAVQELDRALTKIADHSLHMDLPVYASYVRFEGNLYVRDLTNRKRQDQPHLQVCLFRPTQSEPSHADMYIAEDHLGIRQVLFLGPKHRDTWCEKQQAVPGLWWRRIADAESLSALELSGDGLKLRKIESPEGQTTARDPLSKLLWQVPLSSPPELRSLVTLQPEIASPCPDRWRMKYFECNHPDAVGYCVSSNGASIYDIVVHKRGETAFTGLYEDGPEDSGHWMYMPLDEGEYITHISRQLYQAYEDRLVYLGLSVRRPHMNHSHASSDSKSMPTSTDIFQFTTNKGRTTVFGAYKQHEQTTDLVYALPRTTARVHFNVRHTPDLSDSVRYLALETTPANLAVQPDAPRLPKPLGESPSLNGLDPWTWTACPLSDISKIQLCLHHNVPKKRVIGALFHYTDGHRACCGSFRLDKASEWISLREKDRLFIRRARWSHNAFGIASITAQPPDEGEIGWCSVPLSGVLEWWFLPRRLVLFHDGVELEKPQEMPDHY